MEKNGLLTHWSTQLTDEVIILHVLINKYFEFYQVNLVDYEIVLDNFVLMNRAQCKICVFFLKIVTCNPCVFIFKYFIFCFY